jgi:hypothetical protein
MALARCILGKFLGIGCHFFPPPLDVPTISARCLHVQRSEIPPAAEGGTLRGREMFRQISPRIRLPRNSRDLLHPANLRHGTDGFTSLPKECWGFFSPLKIRRLRPGLDPRTWVPRASTLPLDNRSRSYHLKWNKINICNTRCVLTCENFIPYLYVLTLLCHPQTARSQYLARLHKYIKCTCW